MLSYYVHAYVTGQGDQVDHVFPKLPHQGEFLYGTNVMWKCTFLFWDTDKIVESWRVDKK